MCKFVSVASCPQPQFTLCSPAVSERTLSPNDIQRYYVSRSAVFAPDSVQSAFASPALFLSGRTPFGLSRLHFHLLRGLRASLLPVASLWSATFRCPSFITRPMCSVWLFFLLRLIVHKQNILNSLLYFVSDCARYIS
jgi:hypothetical protein